MNRKLLNSTKKSSAHLIAETLEIFADGTVLLTDRHHVPFLIVHRDDRPLSKKDVDKIVIGKFSFYQIAKKFKLISQKF